MILSFLKVAYSVRNRIGGMEMGTTRQDAWTNEEDTVLAEIVLRHIRQGKTQIEAFKQAADTLSRTSAACGFRWNATLRKNYVQAIEMAKYDRKTKRNVQEITEEESEHETIDSVISMLEKMRNLELRQKASGEHQKDKLIQELQNENKMLQDKLLRYKEAWGEMGKLWNWIQNDSKKRKENEH